MLSSYLQVYWYSKAILANFYISIIAKMSPSNNQCVCHSVGLQWLCHLLVEAITITITIGLKKIKAIDIDLLQDLTLKRSLATVDKISETISLPLRCHVNFIEKKKKNYVRWVFATFCLSLQNKQGVAATNKNDWSLWMHKSIHCFEYYRV